MCCQLPDATCFDVALGSFPGLMQIPLFARPHLRGFIRLLPPPLGDHAEAVAYWADREWKKWAVDVVAAVSSGTKFGFTMYVRARTADAARECAKKNLYRPIPVGAELVTRLAGPRELGCTVMEVRDAAQGI